MDLMYRRQCKAVEQVANETPEKNERDGTRRSESAQGNPAAVSDSRPVGLVTLPRATGAYSTTVYSG